MLTRLLKRVVTVTTFGSIVYLFAAAILPATAAASTYGGGNYGQCSYQSGCPTTQHTVTTTPSGLEIAINLKDNQILPPEGYTVTITPVNGSGDSFRQATVYVDDQQVFQGPPAENGTFSWDWNPQKNPGTTIKLVVLDNNNQQIVRNFHVSFAAADLPASSGNNSPAGIADGSGSTTPSQTAPLVPAPVSHFIRKLPAPIVYGFPYFLFLLLLLEVFLLLWQTRRELDEIRKIKQYIEQAKIVASVKQTFLQLASHYLRTPLTILRSGIDLLGASAGALKNPAERLHTTIESIIQEVDNGSLISAKATPGVNLPERLSRQNIIVWLPVFMICLITLFFVYAASHVSKYHSSWINMSILLILFIIGISLVSIFWRRRKLQQQDLAIAQNILSSEESTVEKRDRLISAAATSLKEDLDNIGSVISQLPADTANNQKFVKNGYRTLCDIHNQFMIADELKGGRSTEPLKTVSFKDIFDKSAASVNEAANSKNISISTGDDSQIQTQNPALLTMVVNSLIDNAISYSQPGGTVEVSARSESNRQTITVTDHGRGLTSTELTNLFQPFTKAEGAETFNHEGMGFSLYLDKIIMAYMNGDVSLASVPARQTTATISWATP